MSSVRPIFPDDLHQAISDRDRFSLSCVVVWPGHGMEIPGPMGVIFKPLCSNVISLSNADSGSVTLADGSEGSHGVALSFETLFSTFHVLGAYNEWLVRGAEVVGIFIDDPGGLYVENISKGAVMTSVALTEVIAASPHYPIFTMGPAGLIAVPSP